MPSEPRASGSGRRTYHHGALREALLDGAREMLVERGAEGFSLSALARRLGVSTAAPYRHFADRDALIHCLCVEGYREFGAALDEAYSSTDDPRARVRALGVAYLRFAREHRAVFGLMFAARGAPVADVGAPTFEPLVRAVVAAQAAELLPPDLDPRVVARTLWATLHGLAVLDQRGGLAKLGLGADEETLVADAFGLVVR